MNQEIQKSFRAAEQVVSRVVKECSKQGALYPRNPRVVAHVSRTGKWFLNALAALECELRAPAGSARRGLIRS